MRDGFAHKHMNNKTLYSDEIQINNQGTLEMGHVLLPEKNESLASKQTVASHLTFCMEVSSAYSVFLPPMPL